MPDSPRRRLREQTMIDLCPHEAPSPVGEGREENKGKKPREFLERINTAKEIEWEDRQELGEGGELFWAKITRDEQ